MTSVKTPISAVVISSVEIVLGFLTIGLVLESQADSFPGATLYLSLFGYASGLCLAASLVYLAFALLSAPTIRLRRVRQANVCVGVSAFVMTVGSSILAQVNVWTTPLPSCPGCDPSLSLAPTVNQVVASVVLDIGGGALAALLAVVVLVLLRSRTEAGVAAAAVPQPPPAPPLFP